MMKLEIININIEQYNNFKKTKILKAKTHFNEYYDLSYNHIIQCKIINEKINEILVKQNSNNTFTLEIPLNNSIFIHNKFFYLNHEYSYAILTNSYVSPSIEKLIDRDSITKTRKNIRENIKNIKSLKYYLMNSARLFEKTLLFDNLNLIDFKELNFIEELNLSYLY
jgi:hypothetical protein